MNFPKRHDFDLSEMEEYDPREDEERREREECEAYLAECEEWRPTAPNGSAGE